jgi:hypothetical protein
MAFRSKRIGRTRTAVIAVLAIVALIIGAFYFGFLGSREETGLLIIPGGAPQE